MLSKHVDSNESYALLSMATLGWDKVLCRIRECLCSFEKCYAVFSFVPVIMPHILHGGVSSNTRCHLLCLALTLVHKEELYRVEGRGDNKGYH